MRNRKTILITYATAVRLASLFVFLFLYSFWFNGAVLGVLAFAGSFAAETMVLGWHFHGQAKMPGPLFPSSANNTRHPG